MVMTAIMNIITFTVITIIIIIIIIIIISSIGSILSYKVTISSSNSIIISLSFQVR